jgi:hypothetical protein
LTPKATVPDAIDEHAVLRILPDILRTIISHAVRAPCVIYLPAAFAAAGEHPHVLNARIRAPFAWRVANDQRYHLVALRHAENCIKRDDRFQRRFARTLWHRDLDDEAERSRKLREISRPETLAARADPLYVSPCTEHGARVGRSAAEGHDAEAEGQPAEWTKAQPAR